MKINPSRENNEPSKAPSPMTSRVRAAAASARGDVKPAIEASRDLRSEKKYNEDIAEGQHLMSLINSDTLSSEDHDRALKRVGTILKKYDAP